MCGRAVGKIEKPLEPVRFVFAPLGDFGPVVCTTLHGADRHDEEFAQTIALGGTTTPVFQAEKDRRQGHFDTRKTRA